MIEEIVNISDDALTQLGIVLAIEIIIIVTSIVVLIIIDKEFEKKHDKAYSTLFSIVVASIIGVIDTIIVVYGFEEVKNASLLIKGICFVPILVIPLVTIAISDRSEGRWSDKPQK